MLSLVTGVREYSIDSPSPKEMLSSELQKKKEKTIRRVLASMMSS
jgi:hypothetical protein